MKLACPAQPPRPFPKKIKTTNVSFASSVNDMFDMMDEVRVGNLKLEANFIYNGFRRGACARGFDRRVYLIPQDLQSVALKLIAIINLKRNPLQRVRPQV